MMPVYSIYKVRGATGKNNAQKRARALAEELCLPLEADSREASGVLDVCRDMLSISLKGDRPGDHTLQLDWGRLDIASQAGGSRRQPLLKAVLARKRSCSGTVILDCTAGLGRDAWILAALGCAVIAVERNPLLYALLRDGVARAGIHRPAAARRMRLCHAEAREVLSALTPQEKYSAGCAPSGLLPRPDTVYLDPMFPGHGRRKTAEKKSMRLLRTLLADTRDESEALLNPALRVAKSRVVLKRPEKAPVLMSGKARPSHQIRGRGMRYDIYLSTRPSTPDDDR